jgi:hypothetical protein
MAGFLRRLFGGGDRRAAERQIPAVLDPRIDAEEIRLRLDRLIVGIRGKVAEDLYETTANIRRTILATIGNGPQGDPTDPDVYLVRATALSYLPEAFESYLRMPRADAEWRRLAAGRTPHDVLLEQLQLMESRLRDVRERLVRGNTDRLMVSGRFIGKRFGTSSIDVDDPAGTSAAGGGAGRQDATVLDLAHGRREGPDGAPTATEDRVR